MTSNEQALFSQMQDFGYSHGLCVTALRILSQSKQAVSDMLAYLYDERPSEEEFIEEIARIIQVRFTHTRNHLIISIIMISFNIF